MTKWSENHKYVRDVVCTTTTYMCELKRKLISNRKRLISQTQEKMPKSLKKISQKFPFSICDSQETINERRSKALFTI